MFAQHLPVPSTVVRMQYALVVCTACICDVISAPPLQGESVGWQFHAWQSNPVLDHKKIDLKQYMESRIAFSDTFGRSNSSKKF